MLKFSMDKRHEFFHQLFEKFGVTIHDSFHHYYGHFNPEENPVQLFFIFKITYEGQTGWFYNDGDEHTCCPPMAHLRMYKNIGKLYQDKALKIPTIIAKNIFFDMLFSEYLGYCDNCVNDDVDFLYQCHNCTRKRNHHKLSRKAAICQDCYESHNPKHNLILENIDLSNKETAWELKFCADCSKTFEDNELVYSCKKCIFDSVDFCSQCIDNSHTGQLSTGEYGKISLEVDEGIQIEHKFSHKMTIKTRKTSIYNDAEIIESLIKDEFFDNIPLLKEFMKKHVEFDLNEE